VRETGEEAEGEEEEEPPSREVLSSLDALLRLKEALGKREDMVEMGEVVMSKESSRKEVSNDEVEGREGRGRSS